MNWMKKTGTMIAALAMPLAAQAAPAARVQVSEQVLNDYLSIQQALAGDTMEGVNAAAKRIAEGSRHRQLQAAARALWQDKTIEAARAHFKDLSRPLAQWASQAHPAGVHRASCPMAKAPWLQKGEAIKNPYYGKSMLDCGELEK